MIIVIDFGISFHSQEKRLHIHSELELKLQASYGADKEWSTVKRHVTRHVKLSPVWNFFMPMKLIVIEWTIRCNFRKLSLINAKCAVLNRQI